MRAMFTIAAALTAAMLGLGIAAFLNLLDARRELIDRLDPALVAAEHYYSAVLAQQNALRAVLLTDEELFVTSYAEAVEDASGLAEELHGLLADHPELADRFEAIDRDAAAWREDFAARELEVHDAGGTVEASVIQSSAAVFERLRDDLLALREEVGEVRADARAELEDTTRDLVGALAILAVGVVTIAVFARVALRRWVIDPLVDLVDDAERVRSGELEHRITPSGPPEVQELGRAVEEMRRRLRADFDQVEAARIALEEAATELTRSNRDLEQFAYVASHDLQEPLRKIISFCQLLQQRYGGQLDERADQYIEFAVDGARRMQVLINDLLAFSRVGRLSGDFERVDLRSCADRAVDNLGAVIEESGAEVVLGDLPTVDGEPNLLTAVFQNLIGNAIKFRVPDEAPCVTISAARREDDTWEIAVADNGIGIEPEYADRVFVIFQRLHTKDAYAGTGIGLALCRRIVEHHGGEIWVDTSAEAGTTIRFTLPERQPDPEVDLVSTTISTTERPAPEGDPQP